FHADAAAAIRTGNGRAAREAIAGDIKGASEFIIARGGLSAADGAGGGLAGGLADHRQANKQDSSTA
ncbi:hypothetical protein, partial [Acinetobacter baumannii]|uniref:hypothetical protein n=1 Tax=Acinetobacter baumannii TaxID=470 RepID=UPI001C0A5684